MNSAIIKGILNSKLYKPYQIGCTSKKETSGKQLSKYTGINYDSCKFKLTKESDYVVLGIKP